MWSRTPIACVALAAALAWPARAHAQAHTDLIRGRVTNDSGVAIAAATIVVTRAPDRASFAGSSDAQGKYEVAIANGTGDYLVHVSAVGRQAFRKRVTRQPGAAASDTVFVVDAKLAPAVQQLGTVAVQATNPKPTRGSVRGFATEAGAAEKVVDGVASSISPEQLGDLNAAAAVIPGLTLTSGGFSAFGLGASQNSATLNGMAFPGSDVPREARTSTRFTTSTYDPSRGWFSGANVNVDLAGGNLLASTRGSATIDAPAAQYTDPVSARLGQRFTNLRLNVGGDGPLTINDRTFYSYGAQAGRRTADVATLVDAGSDLLRHAGISQDSATRLLQIAQLAKIPVGGASPSLTTDDASFLLRLDHAPFNWLATPPTPSARTLALTAYGKWSRATALSLGPAATPEHGGENWRAVGMLQGSYSQYWGNDYLTDVRSALTYNQSRTTPTLALPDGRVLVGSDFPSVTGGYSTLQFGGNASLGGTTRQTTWETIAETQLYARQKPAHRIKVTADSRLDDYRLDVAGNQYGTFTYASLADLAANRPSSFSRTLDTPARIGAAWNGFLAAGDDWKASRTFDVLYGARLEGNAFTDAPAYNPAVAQAFGVRTDAAPRSVHVSPRLGFSWLRIPGGYGGGGGNALGTFANAPTSALRGGIGEFRSMLSPLLLNNALVSTGLPGGLSRITCIGADVPTADWGLYASNPASIPGACTNGAGAVFNDVAAPVQLFSRGYEPPRSWRGNLAYTAQHGSIAYTLDGTMSYNLNQPSSLDLNLNDAPAFFTSDEHRPVLVPTSAIVAGTGVVSPVPARTNAAFGRVISNRSDLRSIGRQATLSVSHTSIGSAWFTSGAYTIASTRAQQRGFDGSTFDVPTGREWGRGDLDARHQFIAQVGRSKNGFNFSAFGRLVSGLPFTPLVGGDVNGDGLLNDRAFVFDPSRVADASFAQSLRSLHDASQGAVRRCLDTQIGQAAGRNSCEGPWSTSLNMQVSASGTRLKLGSRVGLVTLNLANPLGGLDQLLHGSDDLKGWGTAPVPDPVLYNVRGFDAAAGRFLYAVNPRFGSTRSASTTLRAPFRLTLDVSMNLGRAPSEQQLERWVEPGRGRPGTKLGVADLKKRYQTGVPNPYPAVLQLADSMLLSREQFDALQRVTAEYNKKADSAWTELATYLADLPVSYDRSEAVTRQETTVGNVWEMTRLHVQENLHAILSPIQLAMLPGWAGIFNTTSRSMKTFRIFSGIRPI